MMTRGRVRWRSSLGGACVGVVLSACGGAQSRGAAGDEPVGNTAGQEGDDPTWHGAPASVPADGTTRQARLLQEAIRELTAMDRATSFYAHHTFVDERTGTRQLDCSGLVDYALARVAPDALAVVPHAEGRRARAADYYHWFVALPADSAIWRRIERVDALEPGDLVAWLRTPEAITNDTGHIMVVREAPVRAPSGEWLVRVIDSAMGHHADDTRPDGQSGIGQGVIGLVVDAEQHPTAFHWSGVLSHRTQVTPIALGRLQ